MRNAKWPVLSLLLSSVQAWAQTPVRPLPEKNELPITAETFCSGFKSVFAMTKQNFREEANLLCTGSVPSALLIQLITTPSVGTEQTVHHIKKVQEGSNSRIIAAHSMRVPRSPVENLLNEEKHIASRYARDPLTLIRKFGPPVRNMNDADVAFEIQQRAISQGRVNFDDNSLHDLKLYRLHPNNFDFFLAVQTLREPTEQFKHGVVLRGFMRDPQDPQSSLTLTVAHFVMNSRGQHDQVAGTFLNFIQDDMIQLYGEQTQGK